MSMFRKKDKIKSLINPTLKSTQESLNNSTIPLLFPSKHYQKCAALVTCRNANNGSVRSYYNAYFLMEGQKRFTNCGRATGGSDMRGTSDAETMTAEPHLVVNNPALDRDEYFVDAAMGQLWLVAVTNKGKVYSGGINNYGNLGHGDAVNRYSLQQVTNNSGGVLFGPGGVQAVKAFITTAADQGFKSTFILDSEGKVYGAGYNTDYTLGDGTTTVRYSFQRVGSLENIVTMFTGQYSAYALRRDGNLYAWGWNAQGALGLGSTAAITVPTLTATGVAKVIAHESGSYQSHFMLKKDGTLWFSGYAGSTQVSGLGNGTQQTSWQQITAGGLSTKNVVDMITAGHGGESRSCWALIDDGSIYSWGYNGYGQLGFNGTTNYGIPGLLVQPTGFPKVNKMITFGAASEYGFMGINMESGRMFTVGNWCNGCIGISLDDASGTWPLETATTNRAHYPAREVQSIPPVRDGYAKIKDIISYTSENNDSGRVFALLTDGTVWSIGDGRGGGRGTKFAHIFSGQTPSAIAWGNLQYNSNWEQVNF